MRLTARFAPLLLSPALGDCSITAKKIQFFFLASRLPDIVAIWNVEKTGILFPGWQHAAQAGKHGGNVGNIMNGCLAPLSDKIMAVRIKADFPLKRETAVLIQEEKQSV